MIEPIAFLLGPLADHLLGTGDARMADLLARERRIVGISG
jgi:hypothetical protein